jgi:hypothetical protein
MSRTSRETNDETQTAGVTVEGLTPDHNQDEGIQNTDSDSLSCTDKEASPSAGWREVYDQMEVEGEW